MQQYALHVSSSAGRPGSRPLQLPAQTARLEGAAATVEHPDAGGAEENVIRPALGQPAAAGGATA